MTAAPTPSGSGGRVLVVTNDFPTRRGGIENFVLSLCMGLDPERVVVHTASMPGDLDFDRQLPFPVVRDPSRTLLPSPAVRRRVLNTFRQHDCDSVIFGAAAPLGLLADALRAAGARRIIGITHGHEVWWARVPVTRQMLRRIGDSCDVLTYVSEWCRDQMAVALSAPARASMKPLRPGVDEQRFYPDCGGRHVRSRLGLADDCLVVVCTARLIRRKGQDTLIRAWPRVLEQHPTAVLLLVGDGPDRRHLQTLAQRVGVETHVVFAGSIPWDEVPAWTDAGDVFAMPCRTRRLGLEAEAFGIVYLEAAACGVRVLGGSSGGAPEAVALAAGTVPRDQDELVAALVRPAKRHAPAKLPTWRDTAHMTAALLH